MATDLEQLTGFLDEEDMHYAVDKNGRAIHVPFGACTVRIFIVEDGEGLTFRAPQVFNLTESLHREATLVWMSKHVYETKIGHFGYDPRDGEIDVSHFHPIEDGELTKTQFMRLLHVVRQVATDDAKQLRHVAFTGQEPPEEDEDEDTLTPEPAPTPGEAAEPLTALPPTGDLPPEVRTDNWPAAPMPEPAWLKLAFGAFRAQLAQPIEAGRRLRLRGELWPELLRRRAASVEDGMVYQTASLATDFRLGEVQEYALAYVAYLHSLGEIEPTEAQIVTAFGEAASGAGAEIVEHLVTAGLLWRTGSGQEATYTLSPQAAMAYRRG